MARRKSIRTKSTTPRKRRANPEDVLQEHVVTWLRVCLKPPAIFFAVPNGGHRSKREAAKFKATGVVAGIPDLMFLCNERAYGIELKAPPAVLPSGKVSRASPRVSDDQKNIHAQFKENGVPVGVCRSIAEVERCLRAWELPLRGTVLTR